MDRYFPLRSPSRRRAKLDRGFTLVEVLVALAVLAIALAAVLRAMGQAIDLSTALSQRTVALWAAEERATDHRLRGDWPALDTTDGKMEFGDREWRWQEKVSTTPLEELRRLEIEIRTPDSPDILARLTVFLRRP